MGKLSQRGAVHLLIPLILILGLAAGVYLVTSANPLKLFSRASNPPVVFKALDGGSLPVNENGVYQTNDPDVKVELTSPLGSPVSVSGPVSGPNGTGTVAYRTAFNQTELTNSDFIQYVNEPTVLNVQFQNQGGVQYFWVEFKGADGQLEQRSGQIEVYVQSEASPSPSAIASPISSPSIVPTIIPSSKPTHRLSRGWSRQPHEPSWGDKINEYWEKWVNQRWGGWGRTEPTNQPQDQEINQENSSNGDPENTSGLYPRSF